MAVKHLKMSKYIGTRNSPDDTIALFAAKGAPSTTKKYNLDGKSG